MKVSVLCSISVVILAFRFALRLGLHKLSSARVTRLHELAEHLEQRLLLVMRRLRGAGRIRDFWLRCGVLNHRATSLPSCAGDGAASWGARRRESD